MAAVDDRFLVDEHLDYVSVIFLECENDLWDCELVVNEEIADDQIFFRFGIEFADLKTVSEESSHRK